MDQLPIEILWQIMTHLPYMSLMSLLSTCTFFHTIGRDDEFWLRKARTDFPTYQISRSLFDRISYKSPHLKYLYFQDRYIETCYNEMTASCDRQMTLLERNATMIKRQIQDLHNQLRELEENLVQTYTQRIHVCTSQTRSLRERRNQTVHYRRHRYREMLTRGALPSIFVCSQVSTDLTSISFLPFTEFLTLVDPAYATILQDEIHPNDIIEIACSLRYFVYLCRDGTLCMSQIRDETLPLEMKPMLDQFNVVCADDLTIIYGEPLECRFLITEEGKRPFPTDQTKYLERESDQ